MAAVATYDGGGGSELPLCLMLLVLVSMRCWCDLYWCQTIKNVKVIAVFYEGKRKVRYNDYKNRHFFYFCISIML